MAKSKEKNKALVLREKGESIKQIAKKIKVSKSTVSLWCRDIILTQIQIERLHERMITKGYSGRIKGARAQYEARINRIKDADKDGKEIIGKLSKRELLIAITALYWGEGTKKKREWALNNSDPKMVRFVIMTLKVLWNIKKERIAIDIFINEIHKKREKEIKEYWSKITGIPAGQFRKTTFIKAKNKKKYKNFPVYYGTISIKIRKGCDVYYKIMGLINGLSQTKIYK